MNQEEIKEIENTIKEHKKQVEAAKALTKLENLPEFNLIFTEGLFKEEALHCLKDMSSPEAFSEPALRKLIDERLIAISNLMQYFTTIQYRGLQAKEEIKKLSDSMNGE